MRSNHKKTILILACLFLIAYGLFQARDYLRGPRLYLITPTQGAVFKESLLSIKGQALEVSRLTLNGRTIFTDAQGNFSEELILAHGVNTIKLEAEDKFGKYVSIERTILFE